MAPRLLFETVLEAQRLQHGDLGIPGGCQNGGKFPNKSITKSIKNKAVFFYRFLSVLGRHWGCFGRPWTLIFEGPGSPKTPPKSTHNTQKTIKTTVIFLIDFVLDFGEFTSMLTPSWGRQSSMLEPFGAPKPFQRATWGPHGTPQIIKIAPKSTEEASRILEGFGLYFTLFCTTH